MKRGFHIVALAVALIGGAGYWLTMPTPATPTIGGAPAVLPGAASAQSTGEDVEIVEMTLGADDAPVEVIEYASYTCPHCATFHAGAYKQLKSDYIDTGKVKFVYREVYFDKYGMWASLVARCEPSKFFGITDLIYKTQGEWTRAGSDAAIADELRKIGRLAGLDDDTLTGCLSNGDKLRSLVGWYQANAEEHGIRSTPSFVIDGELHSNMSYADFSGLLDGKLGE